MSGNGKPIVPFDAEGLTSRFLESADRLGLDKIESREIEHLVGVVTRCSALIDDVYTDERLRSVLGEDPRRLATLLASPWLRYPVAGDLPALVSRLRRIPDRVKEIGDQALFDVALSGRSRIRGVALDSLGPRAYGLAAEVLDLLAADARLREHFASNLVGERMPIEDEVEFLKGCAERFDVYSRLLRDVGDDGREESSSILLPVPRPDAAIVPASLAQAVGDEALRETAAEEMAAAGRSVFGQGQVGRDSLLAAYERLLLFAGLDLGTLESNLSETVVDQAEAIAALMDDFSLYAVGTQNLMRPGSYFLIGPTGVGKNYLVESLVAELETEWGIDVPMLTIEGPNYTYASDINELRGATRGFIRSDEPGLLTEFHARAAASPLSVILVDEIEKAHPQLRRFFLSIMDRGVTTDAQGNELDFFGTLIFFTSNIGYEESARSGRPIGFSGEEAAESVQESDLERSLKKTLSPEFINRLKVLRFRSLPRESARRILDLEFAKIAGRYRELHGIAIELSPAGADALLDEGYSLEYGARHLSAVLHRICNVGIGKMLRRDESRPERDTGELLARLREIRESEPHLDLEKLDREVLEKARARVDYRRVIVDVAEDDPRRIVYRREGSA